MCRCHVPFSCALALKCTLVQQQSNMQLLELRFTLTTHRTTTTLLISKSVLLLLFAAPREGQEVLLNDGRPNGELLLSLGTLQDNNMSDYLNFPASLVAADR